MDDAESIGKFVGDVGGAGLICIVLIVLIRWMIPKLIDAGLTEAKSNRDAFQDTINQTRQAFLQSLEALRSENGKSRDTFEQAIAEFRKEMKEQRQHDEASRASAWRYVREFTSTMEKQVDRMEVLIERLVMHGEGKQPPSRDKP